ncbi:serine hydrolase domain-containing protein [Paenibacillus sp. GCM10027628]|uniref:serine hydrolase domain-containing protein n=1 Tax=Paenibacillus sp. GCM10027628 TaxID=3273413 RepID=UPI003634E6CA
MNLEVRDSKNAFSELNEYVLETKNLIPASAASTFVIQNDYIVNEWYSGYHDLSDRSRMVDAESQFNVASVRKTYLGFAVSLALYEGRIKSLDDRVTDYLDDVNESVMSNTMIRHLLTHTHGLESPHQRGFPPGTDWKYNNAGVNLLIRIVQKVFGQPLSQVMEKRVFIPCGLKETGWRKHENEKLVWLNEDYAGDQGGEANLFVSTRELAFWGYLHLTKGKIKGKQIFPSAIFEQAISIATPKRLDECLPRHGFFWWIQDQPRPMSELGKDLPRNSFQSLGFYGNACLVIPEYRSVIVRMFNQVESNPEGYDYLKDIQTFGNIAYKCILANLH